MTKNTKPLTGNFGDFSGIVLKAAARGHQQAVQHYLSVNPAWLNQQGPHGRTLLWEAAYQGRLQLCQWLIQQGAKVNTFGSYYTPMHVELSSIAAARSAGHLKVVELLKASGARDDFFAACHRGDLSVMKRFFYRNRSIINHPLVPDPTHSRMGYHPIHYAVVGGHLEAVVWLIEKGAEIAPHISLLRDWSEINRSTILPVLNRHAEKELPGSTRTYKQKRGVPAIDQPDWLGFPPLVDACRGNHNATDNPERVLALLHRGANINVTDHKGKTPLHRACQAGFVKITQLLIEHGADPEMADQKKETPIFDAATFGRSRSLNLMILSNANIEHENRKGETPLFAAARSKDCDSFSQLIQAGANTNHMNARGKTVADILGKSRHQDSERKAMLRMLQSNNTRKLIRKKK